MAMAFRFRPVRPLIPASVASDTADLMTSRLLFLSTCVVSTFSTTPASFVVGQRARSSSFVGAALTSTTAPPRRKEKVVLRPFSSYGEGMDQEAMMESDHVIPVDRSDRPLRGRALSKREAHSFSRSRPRGVCHRAFSVFLFNRKKELLLTQRAATKITFPGVWTNTCCSHPLEGMTPDEVDAGTAAYPRFDGAKRAAVRKLGHELGISPRHVPPSALVFLTRFHYWATDTLTYGADAPWGEHEIDYVFFVQCDEEPALRPRAEEVADCQYVSLARLKECMYDEAAPLRNGEEMRFSPWFRGIMERGGFDWMDDMEGAFSGKYTNRDITYFDPPKEHYASYNLASHGRDVGVMAEAAKERMA